MEKSKDERVVSGGNLSDEELNSVAGGSADQQGICSKCGAKMRVFVDKASFDTVYECPNNCR